MAVDREIRVTRKPVGDLAADLVDGLLLGREVAAPVDRAEPGRVQLGRDDRVPELKGGPRWLSTMRRTRIVASITASTTTSHLRTVVSFASTGSDPLVGRGDGLLLCRRRDAAA